MCMTPFATIDGTRGTIMTGLRNVLEIEEIIIHCADTPNGLARYKIEEIDDWHAQNPHITRRSDSATSGGIWQHVGYHYVIHTDGSTEPGRGLDEVGCHASDHNRQSIGICLVGTDKFTEAQWRALRNLVRLLRAFSLVNLRVSGHRDHSRKYCPGFDVSAWFYEHDMLPKENQICEERLK